MALQLEWRVLNVTLIGMYCTAGGQWYCALNGLCYSEHYVKATAQQGQWYCSLNEEFCSEHHVDYTTQMWTVILRLE